MDHLALVDDYEEEAYGTMIAMQICEHYDCRDPREGPFVSFDDASGEARLYCWPCYRAYELMDDPAED